MSLPERVIQPRTTDYPFQIGETPLTGFHVEVNGHQHRLYLKEERFNEFGSVKDRVAWYILSRRLEEARTVGHIVDASSGNYGYALSRIGERLGLRVTIVSSPSISRYNAQGIRDAGANLIIAEPEPGESSNAARMRIAGEVANRDGAVFLDQYRNQDNPACHRDWTAPEVLAKDEFDACFVAASSGGTARGFADYLKSHELETQLFLVDPFGSCAFVEPDADCKTKLFIPGYGSGRKSTFADMPKPADIRVDEAQVLAAFEFLRSRDLCAIGLSSTGVMLGALDWLSTATGPMSVVCICADGSERYDDELECRYMSSVSESAMTAARAIVSEKLSRFAPMEFSPRIAGSSEATLGFRRAATD
ncbi:MAG: hypothetical protein CMK09_01275 [Ponticaulis sp.]|nr:hypothetical protein [Ponticaulis sp.]|tara:strand:+ start:33539 stop:34627 length:1089 start_codon:yes stop_codon:yes gene_type:complete